MNNIAIFDKYYYINNINNSIYLYSVSSMCQMFVSAWDIKMTKHNPCFELEMFTSYQMIKQNK